MCDLIKGNSKIALMTLFAFFMLCITVSCQNSIDLSSNYRNDILKKELSLSYELVANQMEIQGISLSNVSEIYRIGAEVAQVVNPLTFSLETYDQFFPIKSVVEIPSSGRTNDVDPVPDILDFSDYELSAEAQELIVFIIEQSVMMQADLYISELESRVANLDENILQGDGYIAADYAIIALETAKFLRANEEVLFAEYVNNPATGRINDGDQPCNYTEAIGMGTFYGSVLGGVGGFLVGSVTGPGSVASGWAGAKLGGLLGAGAGALIGYISCHWLNSEEGDMISPDGTINFNNVDPSDFLPPSSVQFAGSPTITLYGGG